MNAERSDAERTPGAGTEELVSDPGASKATPGQRASTRRSTAARRGPAQTTRAEPSTTASPSVAPSSVAPPTAEPTRTLPTSTRLPSTPTEVPSVPTPADPPTTELRSPVAGGAVPGSPVAGGAVPGGAEAPVTAPVVAPAVVPTNIYRARRPGVAILLIIPAVVVGVLLVQALVSAALADPVDLAGVIAGVCALVSLPFLVAGVYGLVSGAAHGAEHYGFKVWARPPLAYLLVGLAFVTAAGLAVG